MINNCNNNAVNSCFAPLTPNKQQVINNSTTGDINDNTEDPETVLKELHNQIKHILVSAVSTVDSNGTLTHPNFIKHVYPNIHRRH